MHGDRIEPSRSLHPETIAILAGRGDGEPGEPINAPVVFSSTFVAGGSVTYARESNPTWSAFEEVLGRLEGGLALAFSSGMAATAAVLGTLPRDAIVVMPEVVYYGTRSLLTERAQDGSVAVRVADIVDTEATVALCEGAALLWLESPTNPMMEIADIEALVRGAHRQGAQVVVDNTFATPLLQQPLVLGADIVVHSVTKFLSGHADVVMGAAVAREHAMLDKLVHQRGVYGGIPGPMEAYLALRGLRTLPVRLERGQKNAGILAERLAAHPNVTRVRYPGLQSDPGHDRAAAQMRGFGAMLSFEVSGGAEAAESVASSVRVITHATSLGGVESLIERRNKWRGEEDTPPSLLRLSVGCEHVEDLWNDLDEALSSISIPIGAST